MVHNRSEDECHRLVDTFAHLMKNELDENFFKGDREQWKNIWEGDSLEALSEVSYHLEKLEASYKFGDEDQIKEHAADVANCAMILLDAMGLIEPEPALYQPTVRNRSYNYEYADS